LGLSGRNESHRSLRHRSATPPLQYDVPDAAQAQAGAHRQAGLPGPDDDAVEDLHVIHFLSLR